MSAPAITGRPADTSFEDGWLHTGDIGEFDAEGRLSIKGRKKEMIVTPEGLNVFPEDVERVLNEIPGVKESAAVGKDRVHAVLVLEPGADADAIVREANSKLEDHQRIQGVSLWPERELPRTEGTGKLKRAAIWQWVNSGGQGTSNSRTGSAIEQLMAQYARGRTLTPETTLEELGLSSLERVELMIQLGVNETDFQAARTVGDLASIRERPTVRCCGGSRAGNSELAAVADSFSGARYRTGAGDPAAGPCVRLAKDRRPRESRAPGRVP